MKHQTLATAADHNAQYEQYRKLTKRDMFLATMEQIVPWADLCSVIEPHYPKAGNGRPPVGLKRMLRMYFVQHWFNLADAACEDALLDGTALRRFVGIELGRERVRARVRGGARARRLRCVRIFSITGCSRIAATSFSSPPQFGQCSRSSSTTR